MCARCGAVRVDKQIGLEASPEEYVAKIVEVFREVRRVLRSDGTCFVVMGDSYASTPPGNKTLGVSGKSTLHGVESQTYRETLSHSVQTKRSTIVDGLKPKDLVGIPWRVAFALQADGWWLRAAVIWNKLNPMPESVTDRPTRSHEDVFLLTKSGSPLFWTHPLKAGVRRRPKPDYIWLHSPSDKTEHPCVTDYQPVSGRFLKAVAEAKARASKHKKRYPGPSWTRRNLWHGHDYFYDAEAIKEPQVCPQDSTPDDVTRALNHRRLMQIDPREDMIRPPEKKHGGELRKQDALGKNTYTGFNDRYEPLAKRNKRDVWTIPTQPWPGSHFAVFPEALVEPCILAGTSEKGCCPKCGAPWVRVVEKRTAYEGHSAQAGRTAEDLLGSGKWQGNNRGMNIKMGPVVSTDTLGWRPTCSCTVTISENRKPLHGPTYSRHRSNIPGGQSLVGFVKETVGWTPTCSCSLSPVPATVMDLFGGSGTVNVVARDRGRSSIYIDLKPEYRQMAVDRMRPEQQSLVRPFEIILREA